MIVVLRDFLDKVAAAKPDTATIVALGDDLSAWSGRLAPLAVPETEQIFGRRVDLPSFGQTMLPAISSNRQTDGSWIGSITFGRYFLGINGAAHGGAVTLAFDSILGRIANDGRSRARTAYLHTDFRSITPIETRLDFRAWWVSDEGRKRIVRAELRDGDRLCAEAEALFVALRPGQP